MHGSAESAPFQQRCSFSKACVCHRVLLCRNCMESIVDKTYKCLKRDTKVRWIGFESVKVKDYPRRF